MPEDEKVFHCTTTAQVERTYEVLAADEDQAHGRLRTYFKDQGVLREGLVKELPDRQKNKTAEKVIATAAAAKPPAGKTEAVPPPKS